MSINKFSYDTGIYPLEELFCDLISVYDIEKLHELGGFENMDDKPGGVGSEWHQLFYDTMRGSFFMECYNAFMLEVIRKHFDEKIVYQKHPTLRIQIPQHKGVSDYHTDLEYNHPADEINIWLPFTHAFGSASIYIESEPNKKDYMPQDVKYGEYIMFEGGRLSHGNEVNKTGKTRVSIDMRVIPMSKFKPNSEMKGLAYGKARDTVGEDAYYGIIK